MSLHVLLAAKFLLTNVTREPTAFVVQLQQMCLQLAMCPQTLLNSVDMRTALHQCEHEHDASSLRLSQTAFHNKNMYVVLRCCVYVAHVPASGWIG